MSTAHPDDKEEINDMDDGNGQPEDSDERKAELKAQSLDQQRLAANPNIINK